MTDTIHCTGANIEKLAAIKKLVMLLSMPHILVGDWNMEPQVLLQSGWVQDIGGSIIVPQAPITCSKASEGLRGGHHAGIAHCAELRV